MLWPMGPAQPSLSPLREDHVPGKTFQGSVRSQPGLDCPGGGNGLHSKLDPGGLGLFLLACQPSRPHVPRIYPVMVGLRDITASGKMQFIIVLSVRILTVGPKEKGNGSISPAAHPLFFLSLSPPAVVNFSALQILSSEKS